MILENVGNKKNTLQAKSALINSHLHLVVNAARNFANTGKSIEDIISIGTIGLIKGVTAYDKSQSTDIAEHLSACIDSEITAYLRLCRRKKVN